MNIAETLVLHNKVFRYVIVMQQMPDSVARTVEICPTACVHYLLECLGVAENDQFLQTVAESRRKLSRSRAHLESVLSVQLGGTGGLFVR